ncbi:MAG: hypothetical protein ACSHYA_17005 [Opitutaceae bacterium]
MNCPECSSTKWNRTFPAGDEKSSFEEWECDDCGFKGGGTVYYLSELDKLDPNDEVIVNTWFQSNNLEDALRVSKYIASPSLNSLAVKKATSRGRYAWKEMKMYEAKYHKQLAEQKGVVFCYEGKSQPVE